MCSILTVGTPSRKMETRPVTAVLISIVFIAVLQWAAPKLFPELAKAPKPAVTSTAATAKPTAPSTSPASPPTGTTATTVAPVSPAPAPVASTVAPAPTPRNAVGASTRQVTTVDTPDYTARFSNRGAELVSFRLKHYKNRDGSLVELVKSRDPQSTDFPFPIEGPDGALANRLNTALFVVDDQTQGSA